VNGRATPSDAISSGKTTISQALRYMRPLTGRSIEPRRGRRLLDGGGGGAMAQL
jgi:hypothetical protein